MKILIRLPNYVGDILLSTPVIEEVKKNYPHAVIKVLCKKPLGEILEGNPFIDEVIEFDKNPKKRFSPLDGKGEPLIPRLKAEGFDLGISLVPTYSAIRVLAKAKVKKRVSYGYLHNFHMLHQRAKKIDVHNGPLHAVDAFLSVLKPLGITGESEPKLYIKPRKHEMSKLVIGINAGATRSSKMWAGENFREVAKGLVESIPGCEVRFYGDPSMRLLVKEICDGLPKQVVNMVGKTNLIELIAEIGGCDVFLTGDSGPMHIAASYKVPLVALFGSSDPNSSRPYNWGKIVHKNVDCAPCMLKDCPIDHRCMTQIEVQEVIDEVKQALLLKPLQNLAKPFQFEQSSLPNISLNDKPQVVEENVGVIILGGGMGRRLGVNGAKGCVEFEGKSFYKRMLEKAGDRVIILTSPATHEETKKHVGSDVDLVQKSMLPFVKGNGASPVGNGALFESVVNSPVWEKWKDVDHISVVPVDNPLADPLDPEILGWEEELVVRSILKRSPDESLGTLVEKDGHLHVCEYFEMPDVEKKALNIDGTYKWQHGYAGMFSCSRHFFEKAAKANLPYHRVVRGSGVWLEKLVLDAFPLAKRYRVVSSDRMACFSPIKDKKDLKEVKV